MCLYPGVCVPTQELEEVEAKLEAGEKGQSPWRRELGRICTPVFLEAFVLTFLAEWGDRSQIATISLAAQHDPCALDPESQGALPSRGPRTLRVCRAPLSLAGKDTHQHGGTERRGRAVFALPRLHV